ncbi:lipid phosphate phosphatase epsilon 2, chloroplastic-like [Dioscorea cayenensis subsp. rotundata]|uniref:Lipid phosphate phosphatase epsilon 2, chloroplastic-like n=1 Tax=Dioscorea cayennensis subsp. rotundata TaxID=55577 RepID=A0AB40BDG5_DIOCR|nr:lipid phosphate phosphatase epsilon 2, chloroplastic-like [Dioscorea cayenensis subsp. rotundata]
MPLLFSSLHLPPKSLHLRSPNRFPDSKNPILMLGFLSKRRLWKSLRVSDQKSMPELVPIGKFGGSDGAEEETEMILGNDSSTQRRGFGRAEFDSFFNRVSKWLVAFLFGLAILWKHDAEVSWAVMGAVINSGLSVTLKRVLNHQRPVSGLRSDPGMPSSHAQSLFYAAVLGIISLLQWKGINFITVSMAVFTLAFGSYLTWLRVSQRLHTISQVVVGGMLGSACAITWVWLWHSFVHRAFTSSVWAGIIVLIGSALFCVVFLFHVVQHWFTDEQ